MRLKPEQIGKLGHRNGLTPEQRRDNEFAVRNRLKEFLEFIGDANYIMNHLPHDQLTKSSKLEDVLNDHTAKEAFELVLNLLKLLGYAPIAGSPKKPYVVIYQGKETPLVRPAKDHDLDRNLMIQDYVSRLSDYYLSDVNRLAEHELNRDIEIQACERKRTIGGVSPVVPHEIKPKKPPE